MAAAEKQSESGMLFVGVSSEQHLKDVVRAAVRDALADQRAKEPAKQAGPTERMSIKAAADELGYSVGYVRKLCHAGLLEYGKNGKGNARLFIFRRSLDLYVEKSRRED